MPNLIVKYLYIANLSILFWQDLKLTFYYGLLDAISKNNHRVATWSGKTRKNDKSQVKMEVFEKKSRKVRKFFIQNIRLLQIYLIPYI